MTQTSARQSGVTLTEHPENVDVAADTVAKPFRMAVESVTCLKPGSREFYGIIASGRICLGDEIVAPASGKCSCVKRIVSAEGDVDEAIAGQAVTLTLIDEIDISPGDLLSDPQNRLEHADQFEARVVWLHVEPMFPGRNYLLKSGLATVLAQVTALKYKVNVNTLLHEPGKTLELDEIGVCNLSLDKAISFDPYRKNHATGSFILVDHVTNVTVGKGMIEFALRRATNVHRHAEQVTREVRSDLKGQRPCVLWLTGLSGSGKSTIANALEQKLCELGRHTILLDGDNVRHGLNKDLGFTEADRVENIRRVGEVARLMTDAGLIVITAFISPYRAEREMVKKLVEAVDFFEIYVSTPLEECERRDPKGLYKKARLGQIPNFTGINAPYEPPETPALVIDTTKMSIEEAVRMVLELTTSVQTQIVIHSNRV